MTKQERNLIRDAMMFAVKDISGRIMREATVQSMIDDFKKAIDYTQCCEELCDCVIPSPIDPFAEVDKDTCRHCNRLIA